MENKNIYIERNELQRKKEKQYKLIRSKRRNRSMKIIVLILSIISLKNIYSASFYNVGMKGQYLRQQGIYFAIALVFFIIIGKLDYKIYEKNKLNKLFFYVIILVLGSMPFLAKIAPKIVPRINGAIGWIRIGGIGVQPVEIFKLFFIIIIANKLSLSEKKSDKNLQIIYKIVIPVMIIAALILMQNDLGTLIHYFSILIIMLFMTKISGKAIAILAGIAGTLGIGIMTYVYNSDLGNSGYKLLRIKSYLIGLVSNYYDNDKGYQVRQSLIGIGSGKIFGVGYGNGIQKYSYLPEIHTDFIVTSFGEEFGFIGMAGILLLFLALYNIIKSTSLESDNFFAKYLSIGIAAYVFSQFLINISVAIGLLPVFGIPMPIMSFGGSSLITIFSALGIIHNINNNLGKMAKEELNNN